MCTRGHLSQLVQALIVATSLFDHHTLQTACSWLTVLERCFCSKRKLTEEPSKRGKGENLIAAAPSATIRSSSHGLVQVAILFMTSMSWQP